MVEYLGQKTEKIEIGCCVNFDQSITFQIGKGIASCHALGKLYSLSSFFIGKKNLNFILDHRVVCRVLRITRSEDDCVL